MKTLWLTIFGFFGIAGFAWADTKSEEFYISLLHKLQYVEKYEDLKALIPNCPPMTSDGGYDNTEVIIKTKLFGFDAKGEFNFHKNVLVSHGFKIETPGYKEAHDVFLRAVKILDGQVDGIHAEAGLPFGLDHQDGGDGPQDEIAIYINGEHQKTSFSLWLSLRDESTRVSWGAQKVAAYSKTN